MTWMQLGVIRVGRTWSFSPVFDGSLIRMTQQYPPAGYRLLIAQAENENETILHDFRTTQAKNEIEILKFEKPVAFSQRRLALKHTSDLNQEWDVVLETWIGEPSSGGGGEVSWGGITGAIANQLDLADRLDDFVPLTQKGVANGVATLNQAGKLPTSQLDVSHRWALYNGETNIVLASNGGMNINRTATGTYELTFNPAFSSPNYSLFALGNHALGAYIINCAEEASTRTASKAILQTFYNYTLRDASHLSIVAIGT